ncbi:MAG: putative Fe-S cluster assembly protein SufT [Verrucomicrobia bacterium]|nr:MAG: putative Fe-S cluster assembly protein SufT [Verrucomicrobiota bacterium]
MIKERTLIRDCAATIIPAGDEVILEKGTEIVITQTLGGTVTIRTALGLFRIAARDLDALGDGVEIPENDLNFKDLNEPFSEERVWEVLKNCYDPEIPINIVDLGLIYDLSIEEAANGKYTVGVKMTLTAQGCGMGPAIAADAKEKIESLPAVELANVAIVWDPVWNPMMISEEGRKTLGLD